MSRKDKTLTVIGIAILLLMLCWCADAPAQATDTYVAACASQSNCVLQSGVSWASGNQVWRFTALYPNESIRIWIHNNNPTSAHTSQTVQVFITDEGNVANLTANADRWVQAAVTDNTVAGAKCSNVAANAPNATPGANGKGTCYSVGMYAVQIAVRITGANAQAGNPDTFDIGIVQQPSTYPGGQQPGADSSATGTPIPSTSSLLYVGNFTEGDNQNNAGGAIFPCVVINGAGTCAPFPVWPAIFNGTTWDRQFYCNKTAFITALGNATSQIVALSGTTKIRICSAVFSNTNATPSNVKLVEGTGVNCAGGQTQLTGNIGLGAAPSAFGFSQVSWITNVAGDALCATGSAAGAVDVTVTFAQY